MLATPDRLADVTGPYDALVCDIWGVLHNGRGVFPAAVAALQQARRDGLLVVLCSNVPKPRDPIPGQLDRLGCPRDAWDAIVTSGDAIRAELARRAPGPMLKIGPDDDDSLWGGLGLRMAGALEEARFMAISGLNDPLRETVDDYAPLLADARARDLELLCANPDLVVRVGERLIVCAGAVAAAYAALGGRVVMAGKPHAPIYRLAFDEIDRLAGQAVDKSRILAIGDGIATDVLGANGAGIDALFIASGIHGETFRTAGALDAAGVGEALGRDGAHARYIMEHLT
ncbi:MAG: TIGR01459 family HAD-type hydrolase [Hyphomonadaceae bacterium]|nr:TIGR01459 family HAD-type hydrolase [Hyphomonadaceae bacterium]